MTPNVDESPLTMKDLHEHQTVCDIVYTPLCTKLLLMAQETGCKVVTGEGMLVHQGIESFRKSFRTKPRTRQTTNSPQLCAKECKVNL